MKWEVQIELHNKHKIVEVWNIAVKWKKIALQYGMHVVEQIGLRNMSGILKKYERNMWEIRIAMGCTTNMVEKYEERSGSAADLRSKQSNMGAKTKCGHLQNIPIKRSSPRTLEMLIKSIIWILKIWPQTKSSKFSHKVATQVLLSYSLSDSLRC